MEGTAGKPCPRAKKCAALSPNNLVANFAKAPSGGGKEWIPQRKEEENKFGQVAWISSRQRMATTFSKLVSHAASWAFAAPSASGIRKEQKFELF